MKNSIVYLLILFCITFSYSQKKYPEPEKTANRLFYIQHSSNPNTYVYDANINGELIDPHNPINEYRIVYTQNGVKKPLSGVQKKLAYGMILLDSEPNLFKLRLAATDDVYFYLNYNKNKGARIFVTINKHKIYLNKMFVQLIDGHSSMHVKVEYVLFYGEDYNTGEPVIEKVLID